MVTKFLVCIFDFHCFRKTLKCNMFWNRIVKCFFTCLLASSWTWLLSVSYVSLVDSTFLNIFIIFMKISSNIISPVVVSVFMIIPKVISTPFSLLSYESFCDVFFMEMCIFLIKLTQFLKVFNRVICSKYIVLYTSVTLCCFLSK